MSFGRCEPAVLAQNEITGAAGISDELISLEVKSAIIPNLTLNGLSGFVCVPVKGQPEDVGKQVNYY